MSSDEGVGTYDQHSLQLLVAGETERSKTKDYTEIMDARPNGWEGRMGGVCNHSVEYRTTTTESQVDQS